MTLTLYHRTSIADARSIVKNGFEDAKWGFGVQDAQTGAELKLVGVWLADRPLAEEEGPEGDAVLEVALDLTEEALEPYELEGLFWDARLWVAPSQLLNPHASIRILEVDPRTSWWYEAETDEAQADEED